LSTSTTARFVGVFGFFRAAARELREENLDLPDATDDVDALDALDIRRISDDI
jgi:hypothetical protein